MLVLFSNVGRDRNTWTEEIVAVDGEPSEREMKRSIKNKRALMSQDIDFDDGVIWVGGMRAVGQYKTVNQD